MAYDIHAKSHDGRSRHYSNINDITSTILDDILLVLLMRGIYEVSN
jgi:hypothetical protein